LEGPIDNPAQRIKEGNPKITPYLHVNTWPNDFGEHINAQLIIESFSLILKGKEIERTVIRNNV